MRKLLILGALLASGCATDPNIVAGPGAIARGTAAPGPARTGPIPITTGGTNRSYRVLEDMTATARQITVFGRVPTNADVDADLLKRAAELNADAVINVKYGQQGVGLVSWSQISGTGQAIKYTDGR